jgi:hypothetical protein
MGQEKWAFQRSKRKVHDDGGGLPEGHTESQEGCLQEKVEVVTDLMCWIV